MIYDSLKAIALKLRRITAHHLKWYNQEGNRSCKLYDELLDVSVTTMILACDD